VEGAAVGLDDITRWVGLGIAFMGAFIANPSVPRMAAGHLGSAGRWFKRQWARLLRRPAEIHSASGTATGHLTASGTARGFTPVPANATAEEKIAVLDARTLRLHKEVGDLQVEVTKVRTELRAELREGLTKLWEEARAIRKALEDTKHEIDRADFRALFLILVGLGLTGLAPDALRLPETLAVVVLALLALVAIGWFAWLLRHPLGKRRPGAA